jgi:A/G-specific adenine glycosylase
MKFSTKIVKWYQANKRNLPWRVTSDPYKIWLSEIILQQTRIDQGTSYYLKFESVYPNVRQLAAAGEQDILKLWQGLGYYSRARNLHKAANIIVQEHKGLFPNDYHEIKSLPGIGDYTAAAISSICFNQACPVIDGNVIRVLSRIFGLLLPANSNTGKKEIKKIADELIDKRKPGTYNQAVMEFGALYCKPQNPDCTHCIFQKECYAFKKSKVDQLPLKDRSVKQRTRYFHYLVLKLKKDEQFFTFLCKRTGKDIWQNLFDFPMIEKEKRTAASKIVNIMQREFYLDLDLKLRWSEAYKHILSHQIIFARFYVANVIDPEDSARILKKLQGKYSLVPIVDFRDYPVPRLIEKVINETKIL